MIVVLPVPVVWIQAVYGCTAVTVPGHRVTPDSFKLYPESTGGQEQKRQGLRAEGAGTNLRNLGIKGSHRGFTE